MTAERDGLHVSLTRLLSFGSPPESLQRLHRACAEVDAAMLIASRPGTAVGEIFGIAVRAYEERGFPDEWRLHHQGGITGYQGREVFAVPDLAGTPTAGATLVNLSGAAAVPANSLLLAFVLVPAGDSTPLPDSCAVAWNPSITGGAKSEDTALVSSDGIEVLTRTPELPELDVDGLPRPGIAEL